MKLVQIPDRTLVPEIPLNMGKYEQVLHSIVALTSDMKNVGRTLTYKMLYFLDFDNFEMYERPITGDYYKRIDHGPAPCNFDIVMKRLEEAGAVKTVDTEYGGYLQQKFVSLKDPDTSLIPPPELELIKKVVEKLSHMNASQVSDYSHKDMPVKATGIGKIINYYLVFYRLPEFSARERSF